MGERYIVSSFFSLFTTTTVRCAVCLLFPPPHPFFQIKHVYFATIGLFLNAHACFFFVFVYLNTSQYIVWNSRIFSYYIIIRFLFIYNFFLFLFFVDPDKGKEKPPVPVVVVGFTKKYSKYWGSEF